MVSPKIALYGLWGILLKRTNQTFLSLLLLFLSVVFPALNLNCQDYPHGEKKPRVTSGAASTASCGLAWILAGAAAAVVRPFSSTVSKIKAHLEIARQIQTFYAQSWYLCRPWNIDLDLCCLNLFSLKKSNELLFLRR